MKLVSLYKDTQIDHSNIYDINRVQKFVNEHFTTQK